MSSNLIPSYFVNNLTGKIFYHPVTTEFGMCKEKRECKINLEKFYPNLTLEKQIDDFISQHPELEEKRYCKDLTGAQRIVKRISNSRYNIKKSLNFSLKEIMNTKIRGWVLPLFFKKFKDDEIYYILDNLIETKNYEADICYFLLADKKFEMYAYIVKKFCQNFWW